jgi:hypothetical protein
MLEPEVRREKIRVDDSSLASSASHINQLRLRGTFLMDQSIQLLAASDWKHFTIASSANLESPIPLPSTPLNIAHQRLHSFHLQSLSEHDHGRQRQRARHTSISPYTARHIWTIRLGIIVIMGPDKHVGIGE